MDRKFLHQPIQACDAVMGILGQPFHMCRPVIEIHSTHTLKRNRFTANFAGSRPRATTVGECRDDVALAVHFRVAVRQLEIDQDFTVRIKVCEDIRSVANSAVCGAPFIYRRDARGYCLRCVPNFPACQCPISTSLLSKVLNSAIPPLKVVALRIAGAQVVQRHYEWRLTRRISSRLERLQPGWQVVASPINFAMNDGNGVPSLYRFALSYFHNSST